jgi:hypothetical protein
MCPSANHDK